MKITPPPAADYPEYYGKYIALVEGDPIEALNHARKKMYKLISNLDKKDLDYRYAEGKWTIREILVHLMDGERVFAYRALRFARKDLTPLAGFEENDYVPASKAAGRKIKSILREYEAMREATIELFANMDDEQLAQSGTANNSRISVRSLLYCIAGHELHHVNVIKEKYLGKENKKEEDHEAKQEKGAKHRKQETSDAPPAVAGAQVDTSVSER